ncbi:MAG: 4Fe-4S binding protein [Anaerovoracaceae bacterium]|nr:4Fe-4S binding protein [Bacillota bacterium]MDY3954338.1 4Fe-4S binding protein [Anaerovoracaceae bacterium]
MKRLKFNKEKCIGCELCAQVCSAMHEGVYAPSKARIGIEAYYDKGGALKYVDSFCILCGICAKNCPTEAIKMTDKITVDADLCVGCEVCAEKCPKHVIKIRDEKAVICDTCDGNPMCVQICPQGALTFE